MHPPRSAWTHSIRQICGVCVVVATWWGRWHVLSSKACRPGAYRSQDKCSSKTQEGGSAFGDVPWCCEPFRDSILCTLQDQAAQIERPKSPSDLTKTYLVPREAFSYTGLIPQRGERHLPIKFMAWSGRTTCCQPLHLLESEPPSLTPSSLHHRLCEDQAP